MNCLLPLRFYVFFSVKHNFIEYEDKFKSLIISIIKRNLVAFTYMAYVLLSNCANQPIKLLTTLLKLKSLSFALLTCLTLGHLSANSVHIGDSLFDGIGGKNNQGAQGGEFVATVLDNGTLAKDISFVTFCLENFVNIQPGRIYNYTIDSRAMSGGPDTHDLAGNPAGDALSNGTVFLYTAFVKNQLPDHLAGTTPVGNYLDNHDRNAGLLQQAIWTLEDEYNYNKPAFHYDLNYNPYLELVYGLFGIAGAYENSTGGSVRVLNLWDSKGRDVQSLLVFVPDSGATAVLTGLGLLSLAAFRRKFLR